MFYHAGNVKGIKMTFEVQVTADEHIAAIEWLEDHGVRLIEHDTDDLKGMVEQVTGMFL